MGEIAVGRVSLLLGALVSLGFAGTGAQYVRTDPVDDKYLTGYLTSIDGRAAISWDPSTLSDDDVVFENNSFNLKNDFVSDPLPKAVYLNVSRPIHVDLFLKPTRPGQTNPTDVELLLEIHAGSDLLAGTGPSAGSIKYCPENEPTSPGNPFYQDCADVRLRANAPGYVTEERRMHAELDSLPKGRVVSLRVVHQDNSVLAYGMAGDHRSVLRIPLFGPDEVVFRIPKYQRGGEATIGETIGNLSPSLEDGVLQQLLLGASPALFVARPRSSRRPAVALVALVAVAGCVGPSGDRMAQLDASERSDDSSTYFVEDSENETGLVNGSRGSIVGLVVDENGLPVNGAHVAMLGTPFFSTTDPRARFEFRHVDPGFYRLRIDRDGFRSAEIGLEVRPGQITKVEATLLYSDQVAADARPHRHDSWLDDQGSAVEAIEIFRYTGPKGTCISDTEDICLDLPPPQVILPGTADIEVQVFWTWGGNGSLHTVSANEPLHNKTELYPRPSGQPFHLRTAWEMTDPGHSRFTFWGRFEIDLPVNPCFNKIDSLKSPTCSQPTELRVTVTLHKGVVPLEPAHPDRWGGDDHVQVVPPTERAVRCVSPPCPYGTPKSANADWLTTHEGDTWDPYNSSWTPPGFVPFEADWLEVHLTTSRAFSEVTGAQPWRLYFRGANEPRPYAQRACGDQEWVRYYEWDRTVRTLPSTSYDGSTRTWTWRISLQEGEADPAYAKRGNWCFFVSPSDAAAYFLDETKAREPITLYLDATAHRTPSSSPKGP